MSEGVCVDKVGGLGLGSARHGNRDDKSATHHAPRSLPLAIIHDPPLSTTTAVRRCTLNFVVLHVLCEMHEM